MGVRVTGVGGDGNVAGVGQRRRAVERSRARLVHRVYGIRHAKFRGDMLGLDGATIEFVGIEVMGVGGDRGGAGRSQRRRLVPLLWARLFQAIQDYSRTRIHRDGARFEGMRVENCGGCG